MNKIAELLRSMLIRGRDDGRGGLIIKLDRHQWKKAIALLGEYHDANARRDQDFDAKPLGLA